MEGKKVLLIDDDPDLLELLRFLFSQASYQVFTAGCGLEGLRQFYAHSPDLVILDVMMPDLDGWEVCRRIRQLSDVPLILLTALEQDTAVVGGLDCGADDYITKPFSPQILLARSRAARRKKVSSLSSEALSYNDGRLIINLAEHQVLMKGRRVKLSQTEYQLLSFLVRHAGQVLTIKQLLRHVWGQSRGHNAEYVHAYIHHLRQKIEPDVHQPTYVLTEHGVGYMFEKQAPVVR